MGSNDHIEFLVYTLVGKREIRSLNRLAGLNTGVSVIAPKASSSDISPGAIATRCYVESRPKAHPCPAVKRVIYATGTRSGSPRLRIQLALKYLNVHRGPRLESFYMLLLTHETVSTFYYLLSPAIAPAEKQSLGHAKWFASQLLS